MKVKELKKKLSQFPDDMEVQICVKIGNCCYSGLANIGKIEKKKIVEERVLITGEE